MSLHGRVAFLWHLHQPDVRDPATGQPRLPWVRLHAIRGYYDMVSESLAHDDRVTLNFSGVLLSQLHDVAKGASDPLRALLNRPFVELDPGDRRVVQRLAAVGNAAMSHAWAPLRAAAARGDLHTESEFRDLRVWSVLQWFGATALDEFPELQALRERRFGFSDDELAHVVSAQDAVIVELLRRISLLGPSKVGVSASPFHHGILPLLIDTAHAQRCLPGVPDVGFRFPQDALADLIAGKKAVADAVGREVVGLWPSEGSVSPEAMALATKAGFVWFATDEGVGSRSDRDGAESCGPWQVAEGPRAFFRDRAWSDRLSFDAVHEDPDRVAARLVEDVDRRGFLVLALDGENPWEAFPDAGRALRRALRSFLGNRLTTLDTLAVAPTTGTITTLHTGSWVNADFAIWYGHEDDRRVWRALVGARRAAERAGEPDRTEALRHIAVGCGSDWTWWTGDEFETPFRADFEDLFRARISAAADAMGATVPPTLWRDFRVQGGAMAASSRVFRAGTDAFGFEWVDGRGWLRQGQETVVIEGPTRLHGLGDTTVAADSSGPWHKVPRAGSRSVHVHTVRLREVDHAGIAFFGRIFEMAHDAWEEVLFAAGHPMATVAGGTEWKLPLVRAEASFHAPLRLGDAVEVMVSLSAVGRTSLDLAFQLRQGERLLAETRHVHVCVHAETFAPLPLDPVFVAAIQRVLG